MHVVARPLRKPDLARIVLAVALAWCLAAVQSDLFAQGRVAQGQSGSCTNGEQGTGQLGGDPILKS